MSESATKAKLIAAAITARAALDALLMELTEEVQQSSDGRTAPPPVLATDCTHEHRTELEKTFGTTEHWVCDDCGTEVRR